MTKPDRYPIHTLLPSEGNDLFGELCTRIGNGAVFIYPTETIYGIGGRYDRKTVFDRIITAKGRSPEHQMLLIAGSFDCFSSLELRFPEAAEKCADRFWPGLLTMVLPSPHFPGGIGVRLSDHPFITALSSHVKVPLFSTSANRSGNPYLPDTDHIFSEVGGYVDFMVDAGLLPPSEPSTVVRIDDDNAVKIIREGCISADEIFAVVSSKSKIQGL